jgi:predicted anti-sigma-YlaC factor YlaD
MTPADHDLGALGGYVTDGLSAAERRAVEEHLAVCQRCRDERTSLAAIERALGELPPEAGLDGPPEGADLVLQRVLRRVSDESARQVRRGWVVAGVAAAAVIVAAVAGGFLVGRAGEDPEPVASAPTSAPTLPLPPEGTRVGSVTDPATGARATVRVEPADGWVRVQAAVSGIPAQQRCRLWVVARDGTRQLAGSWLVSEAGARDGTTLDGAALVAPADVVAIEIDNFEGQRFVTVPI